MMNHLNWIIPGGLLVSAAIIPMVLTFIVNRIVNQKLYDSEGLSIFVPKSECAKTHVQGVETTCKKIDEVKAVAKELKEDVRENRDIVSGMFAAITKTLHEHDEKRERAREDYFNLGKQIVALETKTDNLATDIICLERDQKKKEV